MRDPKFVTDIESMSQELMGACPNCGNYSKFILTPISENQRHDYLINSTDLHEGHITPPFEFECSICSNRIGIKFRIDSIIKYDSSFLKFRPPSEKICTKAIKDRETNRRRKRLLERHNVGSESDQDDTGQGEV